MVIVLRSNDVGAPQGERHGVSAKLTKALMPQSCVGRRGASTLTSKEGSELTGKGVEVRKLVVYDDYELPYASLAVGWPVAG
jgi:hypothetical protein